MDIIENIFSYLNFKQFSNVKRTCKLFYSIAKQTNVQWRRVVITNEILKNIGNYLNYFKLIESLQLLDHIPSSIKIPNMPNLKKLLIVFDKRYVEDESLFDYISKETMPLLDDFSIMIKPEYKHIGIVNLLKRIFKDFNIKSLKIMEYEPQLQKDITYYTVINNLIFESSNHIYSIHLDYVVITPLFRSWNVAHLRELKINHLFFNNDNDINELISKISFASLIEILEINIESYIASFPLSDMFLVLPETIRMIKLRSSHDINVNMDYTTICKKLETFKRLEVIDIDFNHGRSFEIHDEESQIQPKDNISIGNSISNHCPYLNCLSLMHNFPKPKDIVNLKLPYLRTLRLQCNQHFDPSEMKDFHQRFPNLRNLYLKGSPDSKILKYIGKCKNIHSLSIKDSNIEFEDLEIFYDSGKGDSLLHLDVRSSKMNVNNKILKFLCNNSPNISTLKFHLKKNTDITTDAYEHLIMNCSKLRKVKITTNVKLNSIVIEKFKNKGIELSVSPM